MKDRAWSTPKVKSTDERFGRFFATFNLVGETEGVLNVYIRLQKSKHYEVYERREFRSATDAGRFLNKLEPTALMFVIDPFFK